jgi:hypothetical protein
MTFKHFLKKVTIFLPVILVHVLKKNFSKKIDYSSIPENFDINNIGYLNTSNPFKIELKKFAFYGGSGFDSKNFLVRYYSEGKVSLESYYQKFQPINIFEAHNIKHKSLDSSHIFHLPWELNPENFKGSKFLHSSHGRTEFGPVSEKKIKLEIIRLNKIRKSIEKRGYFPDAYQYIRGYFLIDDISNDWRFFVTTGRHRSAFLAYENFNKNLLCKFTDSFREIKLSQIHNWPGVKNRLFTKEEAEMIFQSYFKN